MTSEYPNAIKMVEVAERRNAILDFVEWLAENGVYVDVPRGYHSVGDAVLNFLGIDWRELEKERRAMVDAIQHPKAAAK